MLEFRYGTASTKADSRTEDERRTDTLAFWQGWADELTLPPVESELVGRSALALKALCHGPTGAILAAATTSPARVGGRHPQLGLPLLLAAGRRPDARRRWSASAASARPWPTWTGCCGILEQRDDPERLHPLYLVTGRHLPPEADIAELAGYAGSRPVRVGNAAERQVQLDVFGPIVDLIWLLATEGAPLSGAALATGAGHGRRRREALAGARPRHLGGAAQPPPPRALQGHVLGHRRPGGPGRRRLRRRGPPRLGAAAGPDRATTSWPGAGRTMSARSPRPTTAPTSTPRCSPSASTGWSSPTTTASSARWAPSSASCGEGDTVYRYRGDDGLPGTEGGFHLMTVVAGRRLPGHGSGDRRRPGAVRRPGRPPPARPACSREEFDPATGRSLGNHPQAYSHLGVIHNALNLAAADVEPAGGPPAK